MSDERRYDEAEVAEILERATLAEARALAVSSAGGLRPGDGVVAAAMALEQLDAERDFQPPDARGDVRLHGIEQNAGAREAAFLIHGDEVPEVLDVHLVGHYSKGPQPSA